MATVCSRSPTTQSDRLQLLEDLRRRQLPAGGSEVEARAAVQLARFPESCAPRAMVELFVR